MLQEVLDLAFTITYDVEEYSLNFIAPSRTDVSVALILLVFPRFPEHVPVHQFLLLCVHYNVQ